MPDPQGRQFCVTIEDQEGVSPSGTFGSGKLQENVTAYQFYKFTVANSAGSTLTNGFMNASLTDHVGTTSVPSTASYVASASAPFCAVSGGQISCSFQNIAAGGQIVFFLVFRTSTTPGVTDTSISGTVGFKEGANGPNGANPATLGVFENTSLEPNPKQSVSWSPPGQNVSMGTTPGFDTQFSTLQFGVPASKGAFLAQMSEGTNDICPAGVSCFGEKVTTVLSAAQQGTFTASNLFHLSITISLSVVPGGNVNGVFLVHRRDDNTTEIIRTRCANVPPTPTDTLPCITVAKDNQAKLLIINAYGFENGGWVPGL